MHGTRFLAFSTLLLSHLNIRDLSWTRDISAYWMTRLSKMLCHYLLGRFAHCPYAKQLSKDPADSFGTAKHV